MHPAGGGIYKIFLSFRKIHPERRGRRLRPSIRIDLVIDRSYSKFSRTVIPEATMLETAFSVQARRKHRRAGRMRMQCFLFFVEEGETGMSYTVLSPWAKVAANRTIALNPRLDTIDGKTIGMFSHFKGHSPYMLREVEKEILKTHPTTRFSYFQYPKDTSEVRNDPVYLPKFKEWLAGVDGVIAAYGDAGSCAMYHAFNTAFVEVCGKPAVMLQKKDILSSGQSGANARHVPHLRLVLCPIMDQSFAPALDEAWLEKVIRPSLLPLVGELVDGLVRPLTAEEAASEEIAANKFADETFTGSLQEVQQFFYHRGYTNGEAIIPPTKEAVEEMLTGSDLSRDTVIAELPPMNGQATVEKIAIAAVMAGCNPTHLPILIAAVRAMADPVIHLVGWTCSVAGFAPIMVLNGPIRKAVGVNCSNNYASPYFKANNVLPKAMAYIIANVSGVRPSLEDNAYTGHEARFGMCFGEDEENSPWEPYHVDIAGLSREDSAVTLVWAHHRNFCIGKTGPDVLHKMLTPVDDGAFDPGCTYAISPVWADMLAKMGFKNRRQVQEYIGEYARTPSGNASLRWMTDNNHMPKYVPLPQQDPSTFSRKFWDKNHLNVFVVGTTGGPRGIFYAGGGDHGGPCTIRIDLPKNWNAIVEKYADQAEKPDFIKY